jgi:hypothetical protein
MLIPLLAIPLVIYNIVAFNLFGTENLTWEQTQVTLPLLSGVAFSVSVGDLIVVLALGLLFLEVLRTARTGRVPVGDHVMSTAVFGIYLGEFLLLPAAATVTFFLCLAMSFIELFTGFAVSIFRKGAVAPEI